jgi:hypothetical protein
MPTVWSQVSGPDLEQGDYLPGCLAVVVPVDFPDNRRADVRQYDVIVASQSCDLQTHGVDFVALLAVQPVAKFEEANPAFARRGEWDNVRKGRRAGLYWLPAPTDPDDERAALVVDFRQIFSLPGQYLARHATELGPRWRLLSPHREHFSRAFGDYFSRVALP